MKRIIFLGSKQFGEKNSAAELARQCAVRLGEDAQVQHWFFEDLLFSVSDSGRSIADSASGQDVLDADLVIAVNWYAKDLRDLAFTLALHLSEHHVLFWNSEMLTQRSTTKLSATWQLAQAGIAVPETVFSLNREVLAKAWPHEQAIVKDIAGSRGRNNYLVRSHQKLADLLNDAPGYRFMVQEFIPNDYDIRVVCFGGEPRLVIKRERQGDATHLNNVSQGAQATLLEVNTLPETVRAEAIRICKLLGREMAGIDYVVANDGTTRYICLEVNAVPQLTSGSFTSEKYDQLSQILQSVSRKD